MDSEIDPAADFIWDSLGTIETAAGTEIRRPRSDEDWQLLRSKAIVLVEATNLLLMPQRGAITTPFPSAGAGVLSSAEIEHKIARDRAAFNAFAVALRDIAQRQLIAIEHHDVEAIATASEALDNACEACHLANWYPHEVIPPLPDFR